MVQKRSKVPVQSQKDVDDDDYSGSGSDSVSPTKRREDDSAPAPADIQEPHVMSVGRNATHNRNRTMTFGPSGVTKKPDLQIQVDDGDEIVGKTSSFVSKDKSFDKGHQKESKYGIGNTRQSANSSFLSKGSSSTSKTQVNPLAKSGSQSTIGSLNRPTRGAPKKQ